ncbi:hypothetical protein BH11PSE11_BH11PSE11_17540 [soil metagenome]
MKKFLLTAALCLALPLAAHAFDPTPAVKVTPLLKTSSSWDGKPIVYPQGQAELTVMIIELAAGAQTGWHEHPVPSFAYVMEGTLQVTRSTGETKVLQPGETLSEVVNTLHNGRVIGDKNVKLLVMYTGSTDKKLTVAHPDYKPAEAVK